uniref:Chorion peroxidase n=1 Tax=Anopheles christyi TaxID=43041 RepID=A0A182JWM4_9DIPT
MLLKNVLLILVIVLIPLFATVQTADDVDRSSSTSQCISTHERCVLRVMCEVEPRARNQLVSCLTVEGVEGVCCSVSNDHQRKKRSLPFELTQELFQNAVGEGHRVYTRKLANIDLNRELMRGASADSLVRQFHGSPFPGELGTEDQTAYEDIFVARSFANALNLTVEERLDLPDLTLDPALRRKRCLSARSCDPHARYRSFDGTCNNPVPARSSWGAAGYPFERLLPPAYEDGVWAPRVHSSVTGRPLASARAISVTVFPDNDRRDHKFNLLLMQFGQFMSHDFTRSASVRIGQEEIQCCNDNHSGALRGGQAHFACMPIAVSPADPFYSRFGIRCLNFVRLSLARDGKCRLGYGKQLNRITHFIDGSAVYGSNDVVASSLRTFEGGRLRSSFPSGEELLPFARKRAACEPWAEACFRAGDDRANQIISLTEMHTLFLREHNRVATALASLNQHWDDERLYQETRRIVGAELQRIFYNEYLPAIVGHSKARQYGLLDSHGHTDLYSPDVKPAVFNEISGAVFRFGHSTVDGAFLIQHRHRRSELVPIQEVFLNPSRLLQRSFFDDFLFSLMDQPQQQLDDSITFGLTRLLFAGRNPFGSDLASLNIQRGRDHALRPYNDYRSWAGLGRVTSFEQFGSVGARLASVYESPDDLDLWVGGLLEPPTQDGALFGETFAAIISEQFARLKFGDRYYYTNGPRSNPGYFSSEQLSELNKVSLSSVICANIDHPDGFSVPQNAFQQPSEQNPPVPCRALLGMDLTAWRGH